MLRSEMNLRSPAMMMMTGEVYLAPVYIFGGRGRHAPQERATELSVCRYQ